jgi:hypothetical protein
LEQKLNLTLVKSMEKFRTCKGCERSMALKYFANVGKLDRLGNPYKRNRCQKYNCYSEHKKELPSSRKAKQKKLRSYKMNLICQAEGCTYSKKTHPRFSPTALDFHHHKKNKKFNVSNMIRDGYSWDNILKEIKKCVVLCCRCHAESHYNKGV